MSDKPKFARAAALAVAEALVAVLKPSCTRIEIAGSLRRGKDLVGDIELVYATKTEARLLDLITEGEVGLADEAIEMLLKSGTLEKRLNVKGSPAWGDKNKLARHVRSGIPVDLFATTEECWFNYLVCRTGGTQSNMDVCNAAIARGMHWLPYGRGFRKDDGRVLEVRSEREVFEFVGLPFKEPKDRT